MPIEDSPIPSVVARAAVRNFMTAKQQSFRSAVAADGLLNEASTLTGVKARLVAWAEGKPGRSGGLFGRSVKTIVGSRRYLRLSNQLRENREASFNNALHAVFTSLTRQHGDLDVKYAAATKFLAAKHNLMQSLIRDPGSVTTRKFTDLATGVRDAIDQRRLELKTERPKTRKLQELAACIDTGRLTPAMEALNGDERKVAVVAVSKGCGAAEALARTEVSARESVDLDKINAVKAEKEQFDDIITQAYAAHEPKEDDEWQLVYVDHETPVTDYDVDSEEQYKTDGHFADDLEERPTLAFKKGIPGHVREELAKNRRDKVRERTRYAELLTGAAGLVSGHKVEREAAQLSGRISDNFKKADDAARRGAEDEVYDLYEQINNVIVRAQSQAKEGVEARDTGERLKTLTGQADTLIAKLAQRRADGARQQGNAPGGNVAPEERTVTAEEKANARARRQQRLGIEKNQQEIEAELSALLEKPPQPGALDELGKLTQRLVDNDNRMEALEQASRDSPDTAEFWNRSLANRRIKAGILEKLQQHARQLEDGPAPEQQTEAATMAVLNQRIDNEIASINALDPDKSIRSRLGKSATGNAGHNRQDDAPDSAAMAVLNQRIDDEIASINALDPDKSIRSRLGKPRVSDKDRAELDRISAAMDERLRIARDKIIQEYGDMSPDDRAERVKQSIVQILDDLSTIDERLVAGQREPADND